MGRKGVAIFLFISLALSVIPAVQNNYTETIFATAQTELSTEQKRSINQTALRIVNINLGFVGNTTIPSAAATTMVTALGQVIERLIVQTSNSDQIITHIAIETAANPTGPLSQALLLFAKQLAAGDTSGVNQLGSLIAQLTEPSIVNATTLANITGNISQLIMQQAFQSALGANLLLNQIANKLAANSSKLSVNNVTISGDAIAQIIQNIIIQVSLQQQVSFQPLLFIANQVNQNPLGPLSKSIVQLAQLQTTGGASASQSITQSLSELVKQILSSAEGTITKSLGIISSTEPTSEDQSKDTRTKIIIRDKFDEREPPEFQSPPEQPPQQFQDNQSLIVPITNESTLLPPPTPMNATSPEDEILPQTPTPIDTNQTVQLTVIKEVINDNDGTRAAEDLDINLVDSRGESVYPLSPIAPAENERVFDLAVGRYYLQAGGFEYLAIFEGDCDSAGKVTIVGDGINRSCTVKFDDRIIGAVKFVTNVINDNGGNKTARDFQFDLIRAGGLLVTIRGAPPPDGETWTTPSDYTIIPHTVPDYTTTLEGDCTDVLVVENLTKNCTIINDDLPAADGELLSPPPSTPITGNQTAQLKIITEVINDGDGSQVAGDFSIFILSENATFSVGGPIPATPAPDATTIDLAPGTYKVLESPLIEYGITFEEDCDTTGKVTLVADGPPKTCTVKLNDRIPGTIKVVTDVINDNGGNKTAGHFRFNIVIPGFQTITISGQPPPNGITFPILYDRTFTIQQDAVPGYTTSFEGNCNNVSVVENQTKTCTIVNDDILGDDGLLSPQPPTPVTGNQTNATLILNIRVINDDGVSIQPQDLGATVDVFDNNFVVAQILASNGSRNTFSVQPGNYTINFSPGHWIAYFLGNYSFGNTCRGPQVLGAGDTKTCFTTFNDIGQPTNGSQTSSTGSLSVKTHIINNNTNSMPDASDVFMLLKIGHIQQLFKGSEEGITFTLPANTEYFVTVAEPQMAHLISHSDNCGGPLVRLLGGNTTILPGEIKTCTITLDDRGNNIQILSVGNRTLQNLTSFPTATSQNETICDDGIDNDNDVKIDAADKDCLLTTSATTPDENATTTSLIPTTDPEQGPTQTQEQEQAEENNPPTADAGDDFSTESGKTVKLNGEASSDPDDRQTLSYLWEQVSPDSPSVSLNGEKEELASFKAPSVDKDTKFRFELTVIDGKGGEDTDSVTVVVLGSPDNEEQKEKVEQQAEEQEQEQEQEQQETETSKTNKIPSDSLSEIPKG